MNRFSFPIRNNCYDNFKLTQCRILEEKYEGKGATVKFVAHMIQIDLQEKTSFMETSSFERAYEGNVLDAWLYKSGIVEPLFNSIEEELE